MWFEFKRRLDRALGATSPRLGRQLCSQSALAHVGVAGGQETSSCGHLLHTLSSLKRSFAPARRREQHKKKRGGSRDPLVGPLTGYLPPWLAITFASGPPVRWGGGCIFRLLFYKVEIKKKKTKFLGIYG